jgi:type IV pilus assembly protein PilM
MPGKWDVIKQKVHAGLNKAGLGSLLLGSQDLLGIDIGTYAIKIIELKNKEEGGLLASWGYMVCDPQSDVAPEEKTLQIVNLIRAFLIEKAVKIREAATSVSGNTVLVRYVKFPLLTPKEMSTALSAEAEPFIPFDINEVQLGFHILNTDIMEEGQRKMETVLVAAKRELITERLDLLGGAGLSPMVIDVDSFALENVFEKIESEAADPRGTLILNIGHSATNLSIVAAGVTQVVRDIFIAGNSLTKAVMKVKGTDYAAAEEAKRTYGIILESAAAPESGAAANPPAGSEATIKLSASEIAGLSGAGGAQAVLVSEALVSVLKDLIAEVRRSVDFYLSQGAERSIKRVLLSGGSAHLKNLPQYLAAELKVPVSLIDPFSFIKQPPAEIQSFGASSFAVAMGLALRSVDLES